MKYFLVSILGVTLLAALVVTVRYFTAPHRPSYFFQTANRTYERLSDVWVYYDNQIAAGTGIVVPGGRASYGPIRLPFPEEATVKWVDAGGVPHAVQVKLAQNVPQTLETLTIWLFIEEDGTVALNVTRQNDHEANVALGRSLDPYLEKKFGEK